MSAVVGRARASSALHGARGGGDGGGGKLSRHAALIARSVFCLSFVYSLGALACVRVFWHGARFPSSALYDALRQQRYFTGPGPPDGPIDPSATAVSTKCSSFARQVLLPLLPSPPYLRTTRSGHSHAAAAVIHPLNLERT